MRSGVDIDRARIYMDVSGSRINMVKKPLCMWMGCWVDRLRLDIKKNVNGM